MKSKQACYDPAFCRMGFKRFGPAGVLYTLGMVLLTVGTVNLGKGTYSNVVTSIQQLSPVTALCNFAYALVLVQLLLGDLYNPRLSYAIHSLPVTRGGWFGTQIILGLLSAIPAHLLSAGLMLTATSRFRMVIPLWMAGSLLQFLFFFGVAVLCAVCAGNRLGMAVLYGILNFADLFVVWVRLKILSPLIYGMYLPNTGSRFCPLSRMVSHVFFLPIYKEQFNYQKNNGPTTYFSSLEIDRLEFNRSHLWLMVLFAALGCIAIFLAVKLLRRRKPECAGDFLAFPAMRPVMLVLCTLFSGIVFHAVSSLFGWSMRYLMLAIGLVLGYYACQMLLRRQVNVFTKKTFLPLAAIGALVALVLTLTGLDVWGITYRLPEAEQVESITIRLNSSSRSDYTATQPEEIAAILALHQEALEEHRQREAARPLPERIFGNEEDYLEFLRSDGTRQHTSPVFFTYTMKNGSTFSRSYQLHETTPHLQILRDIYSRPEMVFGDVEMSSDGALTYDQLPQLAQMLQLRCWHGYNEYYQEKTVNISDQEEWEALLQAMLADCAAGSMAQSYLLHEADTYYDFVQFYFRVPGHEYADTLQIELYPSCVNTFNWLVDHGYHDQISE